MTSRTPRNGGPWQADPAYPQWNPYRVGVGPARPTWWQRWWVIVPALVLCLPVGLVGLWRRPGVSVVRRVVVTAIVLVTFVGLGLAGGESPAPPAGEAGVVEEPASLASPSSSSPSVAVEPSPVVPSSTPPPPVPVPEPVEVVETPEVVMSVVPDLVGLSPQAALDALTLADLVPGRITHVPSDQPVGTVLDQGATQGQPMVAGSPVAVTVAAPYPAVPDVTGERRTAAARALRRAGFTVTVRTERRTSGREGSVLRQTPRGSRLLAPGSVVTLVVAHVVAPPKPPPAPTQSCTSGYDPCLAPASDYDCAGGSGDGPKYADGPIRVTGSDPYDLDSDGDGWGCES